MTESHPEHEVAATVSIDSERDPEADSSVLPDFVERAAGSAHFDAPPISENTDTSETELPDISDLFGPEAETGSTADSAPDVTAPAANPTPDAEVGATDTAANEAETSPEQPQPSGGPSEMGANVVGPQPLTHQPPRPIDHLDSITPPQRPQAETSAPNDSADTSAADADTAKQAAEVTAADRAPAASSGPGNVAASQPPPPKPENAIVLDADVVDVSPSLPTNDTTPDPSDAEGDNIARAVVGEETSDADAQLAEILGRVTGDLPATAPSAPVEEIEAVLERPTVIVTPVPDSGEGNDSAADTTSVMDAAAAMASTAEVPALVETQVDTSKRLLPTLAAVAGGALLVLIAAWGIDSIRTNNQVIRGTVLGTSPIGGLDEAGVAAVIAGLNTDLGDAAVVLQVGETTISTDPLTLGASLDADAVTKQALDVRRGGSLPLQPLRWISTFFTEEVIKPSYVVDAAITEPAAAELSGSFLTPAEEPELEMRASGFVATEGVDGEQLDVAEIVEALPGVLENPAPYELSLTSLPLPPQVTTQRVATVAAEASEATNEDLVIRVLDQTAELPSSDLRSWVELQIIDDEPTWQLNLEVALDDLKPLFPTLGSEDQQARFGVVDGKPIIVPASETVICCTDESIGSIRDRLLEEPPPPPSNDIEPSEEDGDAAATPGDEEVEEPKRVITIQPTVVGSDEGVTELEALGIVEEVSSFTTKHACCQNRVINIQRFADLVRGVIIRPGEDFSLNEYVGQRTRADGFVADGAIINGVLEPQVGGGISQFATTFFNASFYAGIDFNEYQSHSLYISRYPRGREATISWRRPDLSVKNTTDYGILVWPTYTPSSITVTFYSTKNIEVEDLPLQRSSRGECSVYTTPRVRTYLDGTKTEDSVFALYRPGEGLDCNGNSTRPDEKPAGPSITPTPAPTPTSRPPATTVPDEQLPSSTIPG